MEFKNRIIALEKCRHRAYQELCTEARIIANNAGLSAYVDPPANGKDVFVHFYEGSPYPIGKEAILLTLTRSAMTEILVNLAADCTEEQKPPSF
jgi:hypothetical protein